MTGANGFLGKNLKLHLEERKYIEIISFTRSDNIDDLPARLNDVDFVFHLAGVNRPEDSDEFKISNSGLTQALCNALKAEARRSGKKIPVIYTSSTQAESDNPYGLSKRAAEDALFALMHTQDLPVHVFRLPNVFGKWCKHDYNSVVATFCYNIARDLPISINDATKTLTLVHVDDVIESFIQIMDGSEIETDANGYATVRPQYNIMVGELADYIRRFKDSRTSLMTERVGDGLLRALYATYVSYLPPASFSYTLPQHNDTRGVFIEVLKTPDCGQFSFFSAHPGVTRGGHYHHAKTEKFLVIKGKALFKFRNMQTGETYELVTSGENAQIVETVPGWTHDITNISNEEMLVMLWANEVFNKARPDTYSRPL